MKSKLNNAPSKCRLGIIYKKYSMDVQLTQIYL